MNAGPVTRAVLAEGYIVVLALCAYYVVPLFAHAGIPPVFGIVGFLSALVFSVALMAHLFFARPVLMLFEGAGLSAIRFFLSTLFSFAALAAASLTIIALLVLI
jgi:hypothetical protein